MRIRDAIEEAFQNAQAKGWHDKPRSFGEIAALLHSEVSEAFEAHRDGHGVREIFTGADGKPEGIPVELADVLIRIFDFCGDAGIDLEKALRVKMDYNATRPYRHGGKTC